MIIKKNIKKKKKVATTIYSIPLLSFRLMVKSNVFRLHFTLKKKYVFYLVFLSPWLGNESSFSCGLIKAATVKLVNHVSFFFSRYILISYLKAELQYSAISKTEMNSESFIMY